MGGHIDRHFKRFNKNSESSGIAAMQKNAAFAVFSRGHCDVKRAIFS
jgi:hypothetical protein